MDAQKWMRAGGVRVLAGGVFNIVHPGHVHFLEKTKHMGEEPVILHTSHVCMPEGCPSACFSSG